MISAAASVSSRSAVRAATTALFTAALAVRERASTSARDVLLACARAFAFVEHADLLLIERGRHQADDVDFSFGVVSASAAEVRRLEESLIAAAAALQGPADATARSLRRAARLYAVAWSAPRAVAGVNREADRSAMNFAGLRARHG